MPLLTITSRGLGESDAVLKERKGIRSEMGRPGTMYDYNAEDESQFGALESCVTYD